MNFNQYTDSYGLLVGSKEDKGDSCHRTCMYYLGVLWFVSDAWLYRHKAQIAVTNLCADSNKALYVRHPSLGWWADTDRFSRDQATPLVILLSLVDRWKLWQFFFNHLNRFMFFTNTRRNGATKENHGKPKYPGDPKSELYDYSKKLPDIAGPEFMGLYVRALNLWPLYPLLWLLDLETLIASVMWCFKKETDILNHLIVTTYFNKKYKTPFSWLAYKLLRYAKVNERLEKYFNRVGMPDMVELWKLTSLEVKSRQ